MFRNIEGQRRTHESPMDWEWQTQGPSDPKTPFPQFKPQEGQKSGFGFSKPSGSFAPVSSTPAPPFRNPSFTTPRKPFDQDLFSEASGVDSSPGDAADAEDTPELPKPIKAITAFTNDPPQKTTMFGRYGVGFVGNSPGRAEQRRGKYASAIANRIRKRQRIDRDHALVRGQREPSDSASDSDESRPKSRSKRSKGQEEQNWFASILSGIESRPNLPHVLSWYAQLIVNFFIAGLTVFGVWGFWVTIRSDVDKASEEAKGVAMAEIAKCARDFVENKCGTDMRPMLEAVCHNWEVCMNRDANSIGRASVSARTFAEIFNSFIEPISYKAMIFVVLIVTACILVNNLAFAMFRSKAPHMPSSQPLFPQGQHQSFQWGAPPQTPHHNTAYDIYGGQSFQAIMPSQTPGQRSPSKGSRSPRKGSASPTKGYKY